MEFKFDKLVPCDENQLLEFLKKVEAAAIKDGEVDNLVIDTVKIW